MTVVLLIRHAVADHTGRRVYGRTPGIHLSERGRAQAAALADRLRPVPLAALYSSPMERCRETARALAAGRRLRVRTVRALDEVDYGRWAGRSFAQLRRTKAWQLLRRSPSRVRFPGGETLAEVQRRAVDCLEAVAARHRDQVVALVTHGDVVRLALAHYAGIHIDLFDRIEVAPASLTAVGLGPGPPSILRVNDRGDLRDLGGGRPPVRG